MHDSDVFVEECELVSLIESVDRSLALDQHAFVRMKLSILEGFVRKHLRFLKGLQYDQENMNDYRIASSYEFIVINKSFRDEIVSVFDKFHSKTIDGLSLYNKLKLLVGTLVNEISLEISMHSLSILGPSQSSSKDGQTKQSQTNVSLRNYQESLVKRCWYHLKCNKKPDPVLIYLPTGGGKTVIACEIISRIVNEKKRVGFFVHSCALFEQAFTRISEWPTIPEGSVSMIKGGKSLSIKDQHFAFVCTIQAFEKMQKDDEKAALLQKMDLDYILIDECHRSYAESYQRMLSRFPNSKIAGFTATPYRSDLQEELKNVFSGGIIHGPSISELIEQKYLVPTLVYRSCIANPLSYKIGSGCNPGTPSRMLSDEEFLILAIKRWFRLRENGLKVNGVCHKLSMKTTIVFCKDIPHSKIVVKLFDQVSQDVRVERIDKSTKDIERKLILERLKSNESQVLVCVDAVSEGFDLPQIDCIIMLRPCSSRVLYVQQIGRGLRPCDGKNFCLILDEANNTLIHGHIEHNKPSSYKPIGNEGKENKIKISADSISKGFSFTKMNGTTSIPCETKGCPSLIPNISNKIFVDKNMLADGTKNHNNRKFCIGCLLNSS